MTTNGQHVVTLDGDEGVMVTEVAGGTAYFDPDPGLIDRMQPKLNWGDADEDTYPLSADDGAEATADRVRPR